MRSPLPLGCLGLVFLLPLLGSLLFANFVISALDKLGLSPTAALLAAAGMFLGGAINIPVHTLQRESTVEWQTPRLFGLSRMRTPWVRERSSVIAVNLGGAVIPLILVLLEIGRILGRGPNAALLALVAVAVNVAVCYRLARPIPGLGIALSPFIPALLAAASALLLLPEFAPPVAFVAGVLGPVIGADLLHLAEITRLPVRVASIGGAGTFDGIVLTGLVATFLA